MFYRRLGTSIPRCSRASLNHPRRWISNDSSFLKISPEVREAVYAKKPVVALETTIYTHGYPYPENVALASELESIVRVNGGVPATIGILDGVAKVGLSPEELIELAASAGNDNTLKLSRRDLSYVLGTRLAGKRFNGGTTIAGTMILAHLAGIRVFATGGLGGVHRGAESSMDISADLNELGRTPVAVISSGCKSFLDIPRTLEYLETEGVTVGTFADGRAGKVDFPAFWSRDSGSKSPLTIQDEREAAAIIYAHLNLPLTSGLHFANPIPEEASIPKGEMDIFIEEAIRQGEVAGATGKDNTPFILSKIKELSMGRSIDANRSLVCSNVKRGTIVARELALLESKIQGYKEMTSMFSKPVPAQVENIAPQNNQGSGTDRSYNTLSWTPSEAARIVVAGAIACDYSCDFAPLPGQSGLSPRSQTSNPAVIQQSLGGVAHNVAKAAHYLGGRVKLVSLVGNDLDGRSARSQLESEHMRVDGIEISSSPNARTSRYVAVNDTKKDLVLAMADMNILDYTTQHIAGKWNDDLQDSPPSWFVADANWSSKNLHTWFQYAKASGARTAFEPVSTPKASRLFEITTRERNPEKLELPLYPQQVVDLATPNALELVAMHSTARENGLFERSDWWSVIDDLGIPSSGARGRFVDVSSNELVDQGIPQQAIQLLPFIPCLVTKLGPKGVLLTMLLAKEDPRLRSSEAAPWIISRSKEEYSDSEVGGVYMRLFPPVETISDEDVVSVNGVGDTLLGALIATVDQSDKGVEELIDFAQRAAILTLKSKEAVSPELRRLKLNSVDTLE